MKCYPLLTAFKVWLIDCPDDNPIVWTHLLHPIFGHTDATGWTDEHRFFSASPKIWIIYAVLNPAKQDYLCSSN
jgi:hypothetical protein